MNQRYTESPIPMTRGEKPEMKTTSLDKTTTVLPGEVFRKHPTLDLLVSNKGRVRNPKTGRLVGRLVGGNPSVNRPHKQTRKYVYVGRDSSTGGYAHILVLETWVGPRLDGYDADHIDRETVNNDLDNLRWRLSSENRADTVR